MPDSEDEFALLNEVDILVTKIKARPEIHFDAETDADIRKRIRANESLEVRLTKWQSRLTNLRSPPSPGHGYVLVDCSGESDPMISPTESSRVAGMLKHGPPPPDRRVGCTGPGRAGRVRVGACGRIGDWKTSLRAKQPRRGGSQLWCSADARAESRGLSKPPVQEVLARISAEW